MRKCLLLCTLMLLLPLASAQESELFNYQSLGLGLVISNSFQVVPTSPKYYIDYVSAELSWFPREDFRQTVNEITTEPAASFKDHFLFEWHQPSSTSFGFEERSYIMTTSNFFPITSKVPFPVQDLDPEYSAYLQPRKIIDINEKIRQQASELVHGEDDLFKAAFKIAEWVENNVEYNLSSITVEATQSASWVMDNRQGVCDEITSLFISMCRSVGIPAKFITGISYSNINLLNDGWGPHGWAEVYFPGFGWVPFDVTYKEYGYVDATHIKLKESFDSKETSINYGTKSRNTEIKPSPLEFDVEVMSKGMKIRPLLAIDLDVAEPLTGFGSYNLLTVKVKNPSNRYATARLSIAHVKELDFIGSYSKELVLAPFEDKKLYWLLRVSPNLRPRFIYTFPLKVVSSGGEEAEASFKSSDSWRVYSEDYMKMMIPSSLQDKPYSQKVSINCSLSKDRMYLNDSVAVSCTVENKGDQLLRALSLCLDDQCSTTKISAGEQASFSYNKQFKSLGVKTLVFKASNELVDKTYYAVIDIQDRPLLEITNLTYPLNISYAESGEISFWVKKKSSTIPQDIKVSIEHELINEQWSVSSLASDYNFKLLIRGKDLSLDRNDFRIEVSYGDEQESHYKLEESFHLMLNKPNLLQRFAIWLNHMDHALSRFINKI